MSQLKIPAVLMRGGTSKGLFFRADSLPQNAEQCNRLLLRAIGSPDPYGKQIDGIGGGTSSTSKIVIVGKSQREDADVDYLFGHVAIGEALIDYSGNCGNLTAAVAPFAIEEKLVPATEGITTVRIWQANIDKHIVAHVPVRNGQPVVEDEFQFDGVAFPGAEIKLEFLDPAGGSCGKLFPTGNKTDTLDIPELGKLKVTLIDVGNPTVFVKAKDLDLSGLETPEQINANPALLRRFELIRTYAAVAMGLAETAEQASAERPATPKLSFVAKPADYTGSTGKALAKGEYDLAARIVSMGKLHHAYTGTGAIALAVAASVTGTVVSQTLGKALRDGKPLCFGHPSGLTTMTADVSGKANDWQVSKVVMSRSARRLMEGFALVPQAPAPQLEPVATGPLVWQATDPDQEQPSAASGERKSPNKRRRSKDKPGKEKPRTTTAAADPNATPEPASPAADLATALPASADAHPSAADERKTRNKRRRNKNKPKSDSAAAPQQAADRPAADQPEPDRPESVDATDSDSDAPARSRPDKYRRRRRKPKPANGNE